MARLKLPKPVRLSNPPERVYLYDVKVNLTKEELQVYKEELFVISENGDYELISSINPELLKPKVTDQDSANLVSSQCVNGKHAPVIDVDIPIHVVPSSQLGHYHLYIDKEISWSNYVRILKALESAGIIESGYLKASLERGYTAVRPVGIVKPGSPRGSDVLKENAILRDRVKDLVLEVEHLQKQLENGVSNEILNDIQTLRKKNRILKESLDHALQALTENDLKLEETQNRLDTIKIEQDNSKAMANPVAYNATWS